MKGLIWVMGFLCMLHGGLAQYRVKGLEDYQACAYLVLPPPARDPLDLHFLWQQSLSAAGYTVVDQATHDRLLKEDQIRPLIARAVHRTGEKGIRLAKLKAAMRQRGHLWNPEYARVLEDMVQRQEVGMIIGRSGLWGKPQVQRNRYAWNALIPLPVPQLAHENAFHFLNFRYDTRKSLSCWSTTLSDIRGDISSRSGGISRSLVQFEFSQNLIGTQCKEDIISNLARQLSPPEPFRPPSVLTVPEIQIAVDTAALSGVQSIALVDKAGENCDGISARAMLDATALGLMATFDIVERADIEQVLKEQKFRASGLVQDSEWAQMGALMGAQAILTLQPLCLDQKNVLKAKLIHTDTGQLLITATGTGASPQMMAARIASSVQ